MRVIPDSDSQWSGIIGEQTDALLFRDQSDSGVIGILVRDWYKDRPDIVIDEAILLELADDLILNLDDWKLISKKKTPIDPLADEGHREAYEVILQEDEVTLIMTFTHADNYIYMLLFSCISEYYDTLLPAYGQLIESVRFR